MKQRTLMLLITFAILAAFLQPQDLQGAPYYEGKVIRLIVGMGIGGGNDRMARLIARHLPKYIPGKPTIIIENLVGASSAIAANNTYSIAKPNGLTLLTFDRGLCFAQLFKVEGIRFDLTKFSWIGSTSVEPGILTLRADLPYKTAGELLKSKQPLHIAATSTAAMDYQFPTLLKEFLGLNLHMVLYPSGTEGMLAVERKEADGRAGSYSSLKPYIDRGLVRPFIRGRISEPEIEKLPVNEDLTNDITGKTVMSMFSAPDLIGRPYVAPPGTPAEVMNILRLAFAKVAQDQELQVGAKKIMMKVEYTPAEECLKVLNYVFNQPQKTINEFKQYIKF